MIPHPTAFALEEPASFDRLAQVCERLAAAPARAGKNALLEEYLRELEPADQQRARRFLAGQPVETQDGRRLALGHTVLRAALLEASGLDLELVRLCYRETGDPGEAISLLMNDGASRPAPLTLAAAEQWYLRIYQKKHTAARVALLCEAYRAMHPLTLRYFVKVITGSLRLGLETAPPAGAGASLDLVITAAAPAEYTVAARLDDDGFVNIGKAAPGPDEDELRELNRRLRAIVTERFGGRAMAVRPELVVEVGFDRVRESSRSRSGFMLQGARIVRWRRDKAAAECDTLETVRRLHEVGTTPG